MLIHRQFGLCEASVDGASSGGGSAASAGDSSPNAVVIQTSPDTPAQSTTSEPEQAKTSFIDAVEARLGLIEPGQAIEPALGPDGQPVVTPAAEPTPELTQEPKPADALQQQLQQLEAERNQQAQQLQQLETILLANPVMRDELNKIRQASGEPPIGTPESQAQQPSQLTELRAPDTSWYGPIATPEQLPIIDPTDEPEVYERAMREHAKVLIHDMVNDYLAPVLAELNQLKQVAPVVQSLAQREIQQQTVQANAVLEKMVSDKLPESKNNPLLSQVLKGYLQQGFQVPDFQQGRLTAEQVVDWAVGNVRELMKQAQPVPQAGQVAPMPQATASPQVASLLRSTHSEGGGRYINPTQPAPKTPTEFIKQRLAAGGLR